MEQLFNDLRQQIAGTMGDTVSLIDEDYGQLDALKNGGEQYPVTFPCILLSPLETSTWPSTATAMPRKRSTPPNACRRPTGWTHACAAGSSTDAARH